MRSSLSLRNTYSESAVEIEVKMEKKKNPSGKEKLVKRCEIQTMCNYGIIFRTVKIQSQKEIQIIYFSL